MSLLSFENLCVMCTGGCRSATCTFLISRCSVGVLTSVVGQLDGSCVSHCGPFHHSVDVDRVASTTPFEMRSSGLDWDGNVSMLLKLFLLGWWSLCCLQMFSICLVDPVSMSIQWKNLPMSRTHQLCCWVPLESGTSTKGNPSSRCGALLLKIWMW